MNIFSVGIFLFISIGIIVITIAFYSKIHDCLAKYVFLYTKVKLVKLKMEKVEKDENEKVEKDENEKIEKENPNYFQKIFRQIYEITKFPANKINDFFQYISDKFL